MKTLHKTSICSLFALAIAMLVGCGGNNPTNSNDTSDVEAKSVENKSVVDKMESEIPNMRCYSGSEMAYIGTVSDVEFTTNTQTQVLWKFKDGLSKKTITTSLPCFYMGETK